MKKKLILNIIFVLVLILIPTQFVRSQYQIPYSVIGSGGNLSANSEYTLYSNAGEPFIGHSSNTSHNQYEGFWYLYYEDVIVTVEDDLTMPATFKLEQNYPNPFNPTTIIKFGVPERSNVVLKIYDILGGEVATLVNEEMDAGWYERSYNAVRLSSGVYIYRLEAVSTSEQSEKFINIKKMLLVK
jgi:hypothetical protein